MVADWYFLLLPSSKFSPLRGTTENVAADLESFSRHAGRTTVTTDDVLLITRRNETLHAIMQDFVDKEKARNGKGKGKGRARK